MAYLIPSSGVIGSGVIGVSPPWNIDQVVTSLEGDIRIPDVPISEHLPSHIVATPEMLEVVRRRLLPPATLPGPGGFPPGGYISGDFASGYINIINEIPNNRNGVSLLNLDQPYKMQLLNEIRDHHPYLVNHMSNSRELHMKRLGYVLNLTNLAGNKGGFYLRLDFHKRIDLPLYFPVNLLELVNTQHYKWVPMNIPQLRAYLEAHGDLRQFVNRLTLRRDVGSQMFVGDVGFRRAQRWIELSPEIPCACLNGSIFRRFR